MGERPGEDALFGGGRRPLTIGLVLTVTGIAFEALATTTVMPVVARELHGIPLYGWSFSAFMLAQVVGVAIGGPVGDRHGPATPFAIGIALFGVGLVGAGTAPSMLLLVVARAVQGGGAGVVFSMAYVAMGMAYAPEGRARLFAVLSSAWIIPGILGPSVAGLVAEHIGWRIVFLGLVPVLPLAGVLTLPALRRLPLASRDGAGDHGAPPVLDAMRVAVGAGLVIGGLGTHHLGRLVPLCAAGLAVGVPAFTRLVPAGTLRARPGLPSAVAVRGLVSFAFFGAEAFIPLALTSVRGWKPGAAGLALTAAALTWTGAAWVQARRGAAWGRRRTARAGIAIVIVGVAAVSLGLLHDIPAAVVPLAWAVAGFGMGLASPTTSLVVLEEAPPGRVGASSAALQLSDTLGVGIGGGLGGAAVAVAVAQGWERRVGIAAADAFWVLATLVALVAVRGFRSAGDAPGHEVPADAVPQL